VGTLRIWAQGKKNGGILGASALLKEERRKKRHALKPETYQSSID